MDFQATPHLLVEIVMRLGAVKRWHMIDITRENTLAEHTANVALLAVVLGRHNFSDLTELAWCALVHDLGETLLGDIPTHTKRNLGLKQVFKSAEALVVPAFFHGHFRADVVRLVKLCDLADSIRFVRIHGTDTAARHAQRGLEYQLAELIEKSTDFEETFEELIYYAFETGVEAAPVVVRQAVEVVRNHNSRRESSESGSAGHVDGSQIGQMRNPLG